MKKGQGPTQVASEISNIHGMDVSWASIVYHNLQYFPEDPSSNVPGVLSERSNILDPEYERLNLNPGDYLDLSFLSSGLDVPFKMTTSGNIPNDFIQLLGSYARGLIAGQGVPASSLFDFSELLSGVNSTMDIGGGGLRKIPLGKELLGNRMDDVRMVVMQNLSEEAVAGVKSGIHGSYYYVGLGPFAYTSELPGVDNTQTIVAIQFKGEKAQEVFRQIRSYIKGEKEFDEINQ